MSFGRHPRRRALALLGVLALHALLLLPDTRPRPRESAPSQRISVRLSSAPPWLAPPANATPRPDARRSQTPRAAAITPRRRPATPAAAATPAPAEAIAGVAAPSAPAAAASAAPPPLRLDNEASQRAIRQAARAQGPGGQTYTREGTATSVDARLAQSVRETGKGDCLKGEYLGAGMGLLSAPLLVAAALRGACGR